MLSDSKKLPTNHAKRILQRRLKMTFRHGLAMERE
jgi:hypothetical protein